MSSRNHLEQHLSNLSVTLSKCRLWYIRWVDGAEALHFLQTCGWAGGHTVRTTDGTILLKKKVRHGETK